MLLVTYQFVITYEEKNDCFVYMKFCNIIFLNAMINSINMHCNTIYQIEMLRKKSAIYTFNALKVGHGIF